MSSQSPERVEERQLAKRVGAVTAGIIMSVPSVFGTGEAKAGNEPEPIPAAGYPGAQCVEHPYEDKEHVAIGGSFKNLSSSTVEAQHRIPTEETIPSLEYSDMWIEFAPGQSSSTAGIILETSSIPETEVIFYAKRSGEPEQIVDSGVVGPKDCTSDDNENADNTEEEPGVGGIDTSNACPPEEVPEHGFTDIRGNVHEDAVACLVWWEITEGKTATEYAPAGKVTRGQMASFIARTVESTTARVPEPSEQGFEDIDDSVHRDRINQLAELGILNGVDADTYAPGRAVARDQMASFLMRSLKHVTGSPVEISGDHFGDDDGNTHERHINEAAELGLTQGRSDGVYAPGQPVRRDQMASFLTRLLAHLVAGDHATTPNQPTTS